MRALVIDDSRAIRTIIGNILKEVGFEVLQAGHGRDALDQLEVNADVNVILVDWNMPVMDGLEFIRSVRAQSIYNGIPIMVVTTETEQEQVLRALNAGANEYLMKPFTKEVLVAKLSLMDVLGA